MSAFFTQLDWQYPWALLLALQPAAMRLLLRLKRGRMLSYASPGLRPWAIVTDETAAKSRGAWLDILFWLLLSLALAGPRLPAQPAVSQGPPPRQDVSVMVVLNVGESMSAADVAPGRLNRARLELLDLLRKLRGERVGLVVFAGTPGLVIPPTNDYAVFQEFLSLSDGKLIEARGSRAGSALALAAQLLKGDQAVSKGVLLVSDADENSFSGETGAEALAGAKAVKDAGISLFVLGVVADGTSDARLRELAAAGKGVYAPVRDGDGEWRTLYDNGIGALASRFRPPPSPDNWLLLYPWLLVPALAILALRNFRVRKLALLAVPLLAFILATPDSARAADQPEQLAWQAYRSRDYVHAQLLYVQVPGVAGRMGEGASAYRRKDYAYASQQFTAALLEARKPSETADALFNLGNAQFMAGRFETAVEAFRDVLRYRPNDPGVRANLELAVAKQPTKAPSGAEGIPGRRGRGVGGTTEGEIADKPFTMEEEKDKGPLMTLDESELARKAVEGKGPAAEAIRQAAGRLNGEIAYRAAEKKLELVEDQPSRLLSALLKFEQERRANRGTP
ncbi:MAG: vWA domain-containing protein [Sulfuricella sp.]